MKPYQFAALTVGVFAVLAITSARAGEQPLPAGPDPAIPSPGEVQETIQQKPPQSPLPMEQAPEFERDVNPAATGPIGQAITVKRFVISGNDEVSDELLQAELAAWTGRELKLDRIFAAADQLTALYRELGYGLAQVTVPAQKISDGVVELQVIEGRIGAIRAEGNEDYSFEFIKERLAALEPGHIYRDSAMERSILLLNDLPGLRARAVIKPGEAFGTSDILLRVTEDPVEFSASVDNYGRDELGEIRLVADATFNNLAGIGDRLYTSILYSEDGLLKYGNVTYGFPTGANGSRMRVTANRADYEVGGDEIFELLGITGDNTTYRVDWSYPLVRSRSRNMVFTAGVQRFETESFIEGITLPNNSTELDLLELAFFMNGLNALSHSWSFSALLAGNGKSNESTAANPQTDAQQGKARFDGAYIIPFGANWQFTSRATYVYSNDPLVDSQKFSLGGPYSVRGYAPAELRGDEGAFLSLELRKYFFVGGYPIAGSVFVDGGTAENIPFEDTPIETDLEGEIASAGVGLLFSPDGGTVSGAIQYAQPIDTHTSLIGDDDGHAWATFTYRF